RKDDQVTLSFKTTEPIQTPTSPDIRVTGLDTLEFNQTDTEGKQWEVSGTVLASQNGNASFSIEVLDLAGNKGSPFTATDDNTQVVLDTKKPTLSGITLVSTNANNSQAFAKPGDNITLSFNSSEPIQIPSIILADNDSLTVHDTSSNQDGTSWKVVYAVNPGENERDTTFSIEFKDIAGNEGETRDESSVQNTIAMDTSKPTVFASSVKISSSNEIAAVDGLQWAKKDEIITLIFNTSEKAFSPKVRISGVEVNAVPRDSDTTGTQWEATYRVENILGNMLQSTNLLLRLDATNIDGNHNRGFSEGDQISNWMDLSSKGYTLNRSHNLRPTFSSTGMNGRPAVQFNGNSNLYVENFTGLSTDDYTILVVSQLASASGHQDLLAITKSDHGLLLESSGGKWRFLHRMPIANSGGSNRMGYISNTDPHVMMFERLAHGSEVDEMNLFIDDIVNPEEESTHTSILDNPNFDSG
ncbi:MAG: hypothetical protein EBT88_16960, partial [Proteobacteria bacterium]|nr:hypothetical protein [Pseudomonadota bacterium]